MLQYSCTSGSGLQCQGSRSHYVRNILANIMLFWFIDSDRFLPDKAIDLIDEAGSRVRLRHAQVCIYLYFHYVEKAGN